MAEVMATAANTDGAALLHASLDLEGRVLSTQLCYMLVLVRCRSLVTQAGAKATPVGNAWEYEPDTAGRHASLLLQILGYTLEGEPRSAMDGFDLLARRYEGASGDLLQDALKVALVQKGLRESPLRGHLLHAGRLTM